MIKLYTFPEAFGLRNVSPFCLRVEMALAHLGMEFEIALESDPGKSPKGKLPFIVDEGQTIADSELIFQHLDRKSGGALYGNLQPGEYGQGMAYTRLVDDHLYWLMVASRWLDDAWFVNVKKGFFSAFPFGLRTVIGGLARRQMRQTYVLHGLGKHSLEEQQGFARRDLAALEDALDGKTHLLGERLTVFDFSVVSLLSGLIDNQPATWISTIAQEYPGLRSYTERIQAEVGTYARLVP
ncbi:Tom37 metaxin N-terminal-like domain-containing protein [Congregibacter variabilis]|uniref:Tom37 metaxin N-terminal-like domain-containing protein n=1 Tax=Congregibacter variabilis TaxID=3081200 RepID=A0ABZ0I164_9GAMM|nr:Tom37 metaxin N-terminal-like domain-containing protein [Congregibacter sp. IMCC43200]